MREVNIRLKFTTPSLGNVKQRRTVTIDGKRKQRHYFLLPRSPDGKIIFYPQWWRSILTKAAAVMCKHQKTVREIMVSPEIDGAPRPIPDEYYKRYYKSDRFSPHEAFFEGDVIGVSCVVPSKISDDDLWRLFATAGKYYGISPSRPGEYGFFTVERIEGCGAYAQAEDEEEQETVELTETKKD